MKLQCNIDARGKAVRFLWGFACLAAGVIALTFWALPAGGWVAWSVCVALLVFGAFGVFEACAGWCAVRAMGFKIPV